VLTSFTYIFVFHLGQNKRSYEAIKHDYMNNSHITCRGFINFFDSYGGHGPCWPLAVSVPGSHRMERDECGGGGGAERLLVGRFVGR
jgi:hypothetical protein